MPRFLHSPGLACWLAATAVGAGPYSPPAGVEGSEAVPADSTRFSGWAAGYTNYLVGAECDEVFRTPLLALGPATSDVFDIVTLGRGGQITLRFDPPITDGPGDDFAVFENAVTDTFLELAYVEVSSDGTNFVRFRSDSLTPTPIGPFFDPIDPTDVDGLAGTFAVSYGTPFDLAELPLTTGLDPARVSWIRIIDTVGDGTSLDSGGDPIYDPYPTIQSAGFDLDAVGVIHQAITAALAPPGPEGLQVQFTTGLHRIYQVEFRASLTRPDPWLPVGPPVRGRGSQVSIAHPSPPVTGIYRIRAWQEEPP